MTLGKPNDIEEYICVNSEISTILHKLGFQPLYREVGIDKIYFLKTEEIVKEVKKTWNLKIK